MDLYLALEIIGVTCWLAYLLLLVRQNIWCWIFGIIASIITVVMFYHSKIYMEALLNVYYVGVGIYGWYYWANAGTSDKTRSAEHNAPVSLWGWRTHVVTFIATAACGLTIGWIMGRYTDAPRPYLDAGLAAFSALTTIMQARKVYTCWLYWIAINAALVGLQADRGIYLYAALSAFYVIMSVSGFIKWQKAYNLQTSQSV